MGFPDPQLGRRAFIGGLAGVPLLASRSAWAVPSTPSAWRSDLLLLREALEALHPGLYRYRTAAQLAADFEALDQSWARASNLSQAYLSLSRFLAGLRCGHSYANFFNQKRAITDQLFAPLPRLPFAFRWLGDDMVVTRNFSPDARLAAGTRVLSINGQSAPQILAQLLPYTRADGSNDAKRRALLEMRAEEEWDYFDIFFGLLQAEAKSFHIKAELPSGQMAHVDLPSLTLAERRAGRRQVQAQPNWAAPDIPWTLERRGKTALLTMPGWAVYNSKADWQGWIHARLDEIASDGTEALVIDLRGNEGGLDCGHEVIAHLIDRPISARLYDRRVRYRDTPKHLIPYLDTWDRSFDHLGAEAQDIGRGFYQLPLNGDDQILPKGRRFTGQVAVLTEPMNSSATFNFALLMRTYGLGQLVGGPTGGNQRGINGGAFYFLRLPASGLEVDVPLIGYFPQTPRPDAGVTPDIAIMPTARDIAKGRDPVLERALQAVG